MDNTQDFLFIICLLIPGKSRFAKNFGPESPQKLSNQKLKNVKISQNFWVSSTTSHNPNENSEECVL